MECVNKSKKEEITISNATKKMLNKIDALNF
jgi:hypothetical protein